MVERVPSQEDDEVNANGDSHAHTPDEPGGEEFDYQQVQKIHQNVIERIKLNNLKPSDYDSLFEDDYITEADPNDSNRTILHKIVAELGKNPPGLEYGPAVCEFLSRLLDHDVWCLFDQDEADKNPLDLAASHDNCRDLIEQLCKEGFASADVLAKWLESEPKDAPKLIEEERTRVADSQKTGAEPKWLRWYLLREPDKDTCLHIAIKKNRIDYAEVLLDRIIFDKSANIILKHKGHDGLTPLHLAVDYERCSLSHANLVPKLIDAYPDALKIESRGSEIKKWDKEQDSERTTGAKMELPRVKSSLTPFRYFLATRSQACPENIPSQLGLRGKRTRRVGRLNPGSTLKAGVRLDAEVEDAANKIEESLRLNCMRYFGQDREVITQLLPASQRQIHFDLNPRTEVSKDLLNNILKITNFEPILQYVSIPNLKTRNMAMEHLQSEPWWHSSSRKDYVYIFEWLRLEARVQKILKIIVVDDLCNFHSDEVIEHAVRLFKVESFDWVKLDICSDAILAAAKDLRKIQIMMQQSVESRTRIEQNTKKFKTDFRKAWENSENTRPIPDIKFVSANSKVDFAKALSDSERAERGRRYREKWVKCMDDFAEFLKAYFRENKLTEDKEIKVAIIDDGVDIDHEDIAKESIKDGETFYNNDGSWPGFYQSSNGHGTLMACLITQICPRAKLYIAKLNEVWTNSKSQITAESAAKAIEWAQEKGVDIISMSWSIEEPGDGLDSLEAAIQAANKDNILLFCASNDQGNTTNGLSYPARCRTGQIFQIGAANALGRQTEATTDLVNFIVPGAEVLKGTSHTSNIDVNEPRMGSSIATARCAGLAAVVLQCIVLGSTKTKKSVRTYGKMQKILQRFVDPNDKKMYLQVWKVFEESLSKGKSELTEDYRTKILEVVATELLAALPFGGSDGR